MQLSTSATREPDAGIDRTERSTEDAFAHQAAEQALREQEEKWRTLFNQASDPVFLYAVTKEGLPGTFIEVNDIACRKLGYTREELLLMSPMDLNPPELRAEIPASMRQHLSTRSVTIERVHVAKSGRRFPVEISSYAFTIGGQKVMLAIARDITERKKAEFAIQQANAQLERRVEERTAKLTRSNKALKTEMAERKRAEEAVRENERVAAALNRVSNKLNSTLDYQEVLEFICRECTELLKVSGVNIWLVEASR